MDFSPAALIASVIAGAFGFALFRYGKREQRLPQLVGGLVLMIGPYVTGGALGTITLTAVVAIGLFGALRAGW